MIHEKDIRPKNDKGNAHGYWVVHKEGGDIDFKATYNDGEVYGYTETHWVVGRIKKTYFII